MKWHTPFSFGGHTIFFFFFNRRYYTKPYLYYTYYYINLISNQKTKNPNKALKWSWHGMTREKPKPHAHPLLPLRRLWNGFSQFVYIPPRTRTHTAARARTCQGVLIIMWRFFKPSLRNGFTTHIRMSSEQVAILIILHKIHKYLYITSKRWFYKP